MKLSRGASGLRHLRWGREILGTLEAHYEHDPALGADERALVLEEVVKVRELVVQLSARVKPYRDFLERRRTGVRGMQRVGRHLLDEALARAGQAPSTPPSRGSSRGHAAQVALGRVAAERCQRPDEILEAAAVLEGFNEVMANLEAREAAPLRAELETAIDQLRAGLEAMDAALAGLGAGFVSSLYPILNGDADRVLDEGDPHDDAAAGGA
jgi:hypothetical protein